VYRKSAPIDAVQSPAGLDVGTGGNCNIDTANQRTLPCLNQDVVMPIQPVESLDADGGRFPGNEQPRNQEIK
jgi:hypothetical protein